MISTINNINAILAYRLNFYLNSVREQLIKFKILLLIAIGLFFPSFGAFITLLKTPYVIALSSGQEPELNTIFACLSIIVLHSILIVSQHNAVYGGECRNYFETFPLSTLEWILSDVIILIIANGLLWLPLICVVFTVKSHAPFITLKIIALLVSLLFVQYKILHLKKYVFPKNLYLRLALLWRTEKTDIGIKSILALCTLIFAFVLATRSQFKAITITVSATGLITYITSYWFKLFKQEHKKYIFYFQQFEGYHIKFYLGDLFFIFAYNLIFQLILWGLLLVQESLNFFQMGLILLLQIPLLLLLSFLEPRYKNKAHIFAILFVLGWIYITLRMVNL